MKTKIERPEVKDMAQTGPEGGLTNGELMKGLLGKEPSTLDITLRQMQDQGYDPELIEHFKKGGQK